jgi:serine/threonine protein kinase
MERDYNVLVMDKLGSSLEDLFQKSKCKFSLKTVCMLGIEMIRRVQFLHSKNFIHRDIKPDNFLVGLGKNANTIFMIDYGLSKKFKSNEQHIAFKDGRQLTGTARYASIGSHLGFEQSRRDDLESIGYVLVYFLKNEVGLPWQGLKAKSKYDKYAKICQKKQETSLELLCEGLPDCFSKFLLASRELKFEEEPKYEDCVNLFTKLMKEKGLLNDGMFDWCVGQTGSEKTVLVK